MSSSPYLPSSANNSERTSSYGARTAALSLNVVIVGCGVGGLAAAHCLLQAGHRVTIVESNPTIDDEVGAGIQLPPKCGRLLRRWGLASLLDETSVRPEAIVIRRYSTGERISYVRLGETTERDYGAPFYYVRRVDLLKILHDHVVKNVALRLGSTVVSCDPDSQPPFVTLASGEIIKADLIVGADGIKSYIQEVVVGKPSKADPTGDAAYRALVPASLLLKDPELAGFIDIPETTLWLGPERHITAFPVGRNQELNLVLVVPDDGSVESWVAKGSADKMRQDFADFEPRARKILEFVDSTRKWRLLDRKPLEKWVHDSGRVVLLGDACHPMLPYRAQGATTAIEDAAVLGNLLSRLSHPSQIKPLLLAYQNFRLQRTADVQRSSRLNGDIYHLPDGPAQMERDKKMRVAMEAELSGDTKNPHEWANKMAEFGYDADLDVDTWWIETGEKEIAHLADFPLDS